jgi:hypothetical protein
MVIGISLTYLLGVCRRETWSIGIRVFPVEFQQEEPEDSTILPGKREIRSTIVEAGHLLADFQLWDGRRDPENAGKLDCHR